jgi:hypothetical protein
MTSVAIKAIRLCRDVKWRCADSLSAKRTDVPSGLAVQAEDRLLGQQVVGGTFVDVMHPGTV